MSNLYEYVIGIRRIWYASDKIVNVTPINHLHSCFKWLDMNKYKMVSLYFRGTYRKIFHLLLLMIRTSVDPPIRKTVTPLHSTLRQNWNLSTSQFIHCFSK